jgi:hypothetical protein
VLEGEHVTGGEVFDVDVVADRGAVGRRVVGAEQLQWRPLAEHRLHEDRHQVLAVGEVLADGAVVGCAGGVEVAEADGTHRAGRTEPLEHPLDHQLGLAVDALGVESDGLVDRVALGRAVHRGRRGEDEALDAGALQRVEERERPADVVAEVPGRLVHRLTDGLQRGEVDAGVDVVLRDELLDEHAIVDVADDERRTQHRRLVAVAEVVEDEHLTPGGAQRADGVRPDVAGTSRDQHGHDPRSALASARCTLAPSLWAS